MRDWFLFISGVIITGVAVCSGCATDADKTKEPQPAMRAMGQPVSTPHKFYGPEEVPTNDSIGLEIRRQLNTDAPDDRGYHCGGGRRQCHPPRDRAELAASWRAEAAAHATKGVKAW